VVEPVGILQGGDLDLLGGAPRSLGLDQLGLEQADDRLGQGVVYDGARSALLCAVTPITDYGDQPIC
jgi:hypothetical protein